MAATIKIKNSSTAGAAPTSSDLVQGELAVNVTDKRLYTENASGTIVELGTNPSVPVTFPDGSASAPSLTNDGDTNTGIFFPAADTIALTTGGTERLRLDSSGNLGLGVTPSTWSSSWKAFQFGPRSSLAAWATDAGTNLSANAYNDGSWKYIATATAAQYAITSTGEHRWNIAASGTAGNAITFTQAMTLDASGNLGVGTTSPTSVSNYKGITLNGTTGGLVDIASNGTVGLRLQCDTTYPGGALFTLTNQPMVFGTNGTERARIDSSGNLLVGTTDYTTVAAGAFTFRSIGTTNTYLSIGHKTGSISGADFVAFYYNTSQIGGCAQNGTTAVSFNTTSDHRLKTNVVALTGGLEKVMALKPSSFTWVDGRQDEGFIAHELQEVLPNVVTGEKDATNEDDSPKYQQVDYSKIVTVLTAAIQEQQAIIETLTNRITALEQA